MAEQATESPHPDAEGAGGAGGSSPHETALFPRALAEPTEPVTKTWIGTLGLASLAMWMATLTPIQVLLPEQIQHVDPKGKILALGLVSAFGAVASLLATPIAGAFSDRTTHAWRIGRLNGRRHRWTLIMAVLAAICLALTAAQTTVLGIGVLWVLFSAFQNGEYASLSAAVPDHVPVNQRATVAGWVGMPQALGLVLGTAVIVYVFTSKGGDYTASYLALAIPMVVFTLPFVFATPDYPLPPEHRLRCRCERCWPPTGWTPSATRTSPGPGLPGSSPRWRSAWAPCTCCTSCATRCITPIRPRACSS